MPSSLHFLGISLSPVGASPRWSPHALRASCSIFRLRAERFVWPFPHPCIFVWFCGLVIFASSICVTMTLVMLTQPGRLILVYTTVNNDCPSLRMQEGSRLQWPCQKIAFLSPYSYVSYIFFLFPYCNAPRILNVQFRADHSTAT